MSEQDARLTEFDGHESPDGLDLGPIRIEIPDEWETRELSNVFDLITGNSYTGDHLSEEDNGGRIFLTLKSVKKGGGFNWESIKYYSGEVNEQEIVEPGELLIANTDVTQDGDVVGYSIRVPNFNSDKEIAASMDLSILRPRIAEINQPYIEYLLQTNYIHSRMRAFSAGSTVLHLNTDLVESLSLPLPPLEEQRNIASVLYTVDQEIQHTEHVIDQIEHVRKGLVQDIVFQGFGNTDLIEERLGPKRVEIPSHWEVTVFGDVSKVQQGLQIAKAERYNEDAEDRYQYITVQYLNEPNKERNIWYIEAPRDSVLCETDDILMTRTGNTGEVVTGVEGAFHNNFFKVDFDRDIFIKDYLVHFLESAPIQRLLLGYAGTTTIPDLNHGEFFNIPVIIPPYEEQEEIAGVLRSFDNRASIEKDILRQLRRIKRGVMQDLLSGEVRTHDKEIDTVDEVLAHG